MISSPVVESRFPVGSSANRILGFVTNAQRQFPRELLRRAVAILAFDFDLCQRGAGDVTVTVHVDCGGAVLADTVLCRITLTALDLVVQVIGDEDILLGVQLGLLLAFGIERRTVGGFDQALVGHTDAFAAVVAGVTGFDRDTRVGDIVVMHLRLARGLYLVAHQVAFLRFVDGRVIALVDAFIAVGNVAGRTTLAAVVAPSVLMMGSSSLQDFVGKYS